MVSLQSIETQLKHIGCNFKIWGRAEIRELSNVLMPDEKIAQCTNGHYEGGFALLAATDQRLLLVDRKPMFLTLEAISYDMIAEVDFHRRLLDATIRVFTLNKALVFTSWNQHRLRVILVYTQQRVTEMRQQYMSQVVQQGSEQLQRVQPLYQTMQPAGASPTSVSLSYSAKMPVLPRRRQF